MEWDTHTKDITYTLICTLSVSCEIFSVIFNHDMLADESLLWTHTHTFRDEHERWERYLVLCPCLEYQSSTGMFWWSKNAIITLLSLMSQFSESWLWINCSSRGNENVRNPSWNASFTKNKTWEANDANERILQNAFGFQKSSSVKTEMLIILNPLLAEEQVQ